MIYVDARLLLPFEKCLQLDGNKKSRAKAGTKSKKIVKKPKNCNAEKVPPAAEPVASPRPKNKIRRANSSKTTNNHKRKVLQSSPAVTAEILLNCNDAKCEIESSSSESPEELESLAYLKVEPVDQGTSGKEAESDETPMDVVDSFNAAAAAAAAPEIVEKTEESKSETMSMPNGVIKTTDDRECIWANDSVRSELLFIVNILRSTAMLIQLLNHFEYGMHCHGSVIHLIFYEHALFCLIYGFCDSNQAIVIVKTNLLQNKKRCKLQGCNQ